MPAAESLKKELKENESRVSSSNHSATEATGSSESSALPSRSSVIDAEKYFVPFELACSSKSPKIVMTALDCIQKLIAYGHLTGNNPDPRNPSRLLIDCIVETICSCFNGPSTDDGVQLQIIKALLTLVTSPETNVHEGSILLTVRTCYNIYLGSKNLVNQTTAKATLTQMLNVIFARMETEMELLDKNGQFNVSMNGGGQHSDLNQSSNSNVSMNQVQQSNGAINSDCNSFKSDTISVTTIDTSLNRSSTPIEELDPVVVNLMNDVLDNVSMMVDPRPVSSQSKLNDGIILSPIDQLMGNHVHNHHNGGGGGSNGTRLEKAGRVPSTDSIGSSSSESNMTADGTIDTNKSNHHHSHHHQTFLHITQKDAYLVFRSLCKLSAKQLPDGVPDPKSHELRSKVLSLQLILTILQNSGPSFQSSELFSNAIKQFLCVALSKNGVSIITEVFELSLAIFLVLLTNFKVHLKMQIEVFFRDIFLNILETPSSSFDHKWMVIQSLNKICSNAQSVVDIYINYDCNLSSANIFERLVNDLSKIAQGRGCSLLQSGLISPNQERSMRIRGYECLVSILKCMVTWTSDLFINPSSQTITGDDADGQIAGQDSGLNSVDADTVDKRSSMASSVVEDDYDDPSKTAVGKELKTTIEEGIRLFNRKPKSGLKFLQERKLLGETSSDVATFFHHEERLDKTMIGEYMGENEVFNKEVMYKYVDQMDFEGKDIVTALRSFLEGFRLPGEAQKIDRLMEKFASRYCETNPNSNIFASADTAYVLSYSIIMLTTDLHSPQVKNKMTKEQYIKMNRGINDSKDLPEEYLSAIYDEISGSEIKMRHGHMASSSRTVSTAAKDEKTRKFIYNLEMEQIAKTARLLMESVAHAEAPYVTAKHCEHVKPMFKLAWTPFLAAFSVGLNDSEELEIVVSCLDGIKNAIRIACVFRMETERNAYVQALARFTLLSTSSLTGSMSTISEMKPKNIETIKTLIAVANSDGNYLGSNWLDVLRCISQLELAQMIGTGSLKSPSNTTGSRNPFGSVNSTSGLMNGGLSSRMEVLSIENLTGRKSQSDHYQLTNSSSNYSLSETSSQEVVVAVDRIFHKGSTLLDGDAVVHFVRSLCQVSNEELSLPSPRMFSLQRIVEFSFHNMTRIRLQWSRIWAILGEHFNKAGCSHNTDIAYFAIDSLRQLSMKFIEKGEFSNFRFQKDFLRPFEVIMKRTNLDDVRRFVVECITQMVNLQSKKIMSGWKNIFSVFRISATDQNQDIIAFGFHTTNTIVTSILKENFIPMIDSFQDAVKCLSDFACNESLPEISMNAIKLIGDCAEFVAVEGKCIKINSSYLFSHDDSSDASLTTIRRPLANSPPPTSPSSPPTIGVGVPVGTADGHQVTIDDNQAIWVRGWFPILFELSCIVITTKVDVRTRALSVMFEIIKINGSTFKPDWWNDLFQIIFRIFDYMKIPDNVDFADKSEWMKNTCSLALHSIVEVFTQYFDMLGPSLLSQFYNQLIWCVSQDDESLAVSAINYFGNLVTLNGQKETFNQETWLLTSQCFIGLIKSTKPDELLTWTPPMIQKVPVNQSPRKTSLVTTTASARDSPDIAKFFLSIKCKCIVQLELIQIIDHIIFSPGASKKEDIELIGDLQSELESRTARSRLLTNRSMQSSKSNVSGDNSSDGHSMARSMSISTSNLSRSRSREDNIDSDLKRKSMYIRMSTPVLLELKDALMESHEFAKLFNSNNDQRNVLWKAGFHGNAKPNLMSQESQSLSLALRILFKIYDDEDRKEDWDIVEKEIQRYGLIFYCNLLI